MYSNRNGTGKTHPGQNLPDKNPGQTPDKNPSERRQTPCKDICMYACTTKNWGPEMCDKV